MGGFTFNGCGATDSFYPIKSVGTFFCKHCGREVTFTLSEVRRKVRVVWIPTVTLTTKFAVVCTNCKTGFYVSDQQKDDILYERVSLRMERDGLALEVKGESRPQPREKNTFNVRSNNEKTELQSPRNSMWEINDDIEPPPKTASVPTIRENVSFEEKKPFVTPEIKKTAVKICPECKMMYASTKETCTLCGVALVEKD
ncbi:MAG: hypothetical protein E7473_11995 [Ruminococcaceae bacterium]|nr:hypothetical protein [Oscillospiraceae bacterium]